MTDLFDNSTGAKKPLTGAPPVRTGAPVIPLKSGNRGAPVSPPRPVGNRGTLPTREGRAPPIALLRKEMEGLYLELMTARRERDLAKTAVTARQPAIVAARECLKMYFEQQGMPPTAVGWRVSRPLYEAHDAAQRDAYPFKEAAKNAERIVKAVTDRLKDINLEIGE